ncbi:D-sedoheptulose 7-phosphate isomerase [Anaerobacterium chartisolvens]|uniref:D,D-heptose 1,7-bisphosphate phosphatase n=1 Tax=Anaerobacterium chartisolvens TaxID=1297424 RepID=A0A369ATI8_9FIRM|nr:HAD-IIIA family hydrolase [Anaerobacterium chartisolvens]RCX12541.1 D-sedoheptulose 7-phosphate isomerase [Anaerobacterium chartisolvens]
MAIAIDTYFKSVSELAGLTEQCAFKAVLDEIKLASKKRRSILLIGNGEDAATASHFANDLMKNAGIKITSMLGFGIKVIALSENMAFFTAVSNDVSMNQAYAAYLSAYASAGDLVIIFSSQQPHANLIEAAKFGRRRGLCVASITGNFAGGLEKFSHVLYKVASNVPEHIQDMHSFLCHSWTVTLRDELVQPVVFLDRDGVINKNRPDYIKSWDEFLFLPGVPDAIRRLNEKGYAVVVVTNQSAVGRNIISEKELERIHVKMCNSLLKHGALISKIYYCPHSPEEGCECRKPADGLIRRAFEELPLDRGKAIMVGDSACDIEAGYKSGAATVLLANTLEDAKGLKVVPDYLAADLPLAVDLILNKM